MTRRDLLARLLGATALTVAGLVVPARKTYVFLTANPLADTHALHLDRHREWMTQLDLSHAATRHTFMALMVANRRFLQGDAP